MLPLLLAVNIEVRPLLLTARAIEAIVKWEERSRPAMVEVSILPRGRKEAVVTKRVFVPRGERSVTVRLGVAEVKPGRYLVVARLFDREGREAERTSVPVEIPPIPRWWGSKLGLERTAPRPWHPVEVVFSENSARVEVWGRSFSFNGSPFPTVIFNRGRPMLSGPVRLWGELYGRPFSFEGFRLLLVERSEERATFVGTSSAKGVWAEVRTSVEFDGAMRFDLRLDPRGQYVNRLTLDIPLRREWAKFVYHWPPGWPHIDGTFPLPKGGWRGPFYHYLWVGNERGGLCWFAESEEPFIKGRETGDEERVLEVLPEGKAVIIRINFLLNNTLPTAREYAVTFGLLPTPVKPWPRNYHKFHVAVDVVYGMERKEFGFGSTLAYPLEGALDPRRGTFEMWVRLGFDPSRDEARLLTIQYRLFRNELFLRWLPKLRLSGKPGLELRVVWDRRSEPLYIEVPLNWRRGEWHHLALTWGDEIVLYADGRAVGRRRFQGLVGRGGDTRHTNLVIGGSPVPLTVDEIRTSRIVRRALSPRRPEADEATLLLDRLEGEGKGPLRRTAPEKGPPGRPSYFAKFVEGRFGRALLLYGRKFGISTFEYMHRIGVDAINLPEWWTDKQGTTDTAHKERLRQLVRRAHRHGLKVLLYFGFEMGDVAEEWKHYRYELASRIPPQQGVFLRVRPLSPPQVYQPIDHGSQPYQDYLIEGISRLMREFDIDGVYLDGTHLAGGCANPYHGHGWVDKEGRRHPISFIWESRRLMKRMYRVIKGRKPDGVIFAHTSAAVLAPTLSFADAYYNGEQLGPIVMRERREGYKPPAEIVPLTTFRVLFYGRPWGGPCHLHPGGFELEEALSLSLLHDVFVAPYAPAGERLALMGEIWRIYEEFDADRAEWHPYWEPNPPVHAEPEGKVPASCHVRREKGRALIVVSNLTTKPLQATLRLDLKQLNLTGVPVRAWDPLNGERLRLKGGRSRFLLKPVGFKIIRIERGGSKKPLEGG